VLYLLRYGRRGDYKVGDTVHRVGEMVQEAGDMGSSILAKTKKQKTKTEVSVP
jgi:hypothetical protein